MSNTATAHDKILLLEVTGGFLQGVKIDFADGLNRIIGGNAPSKYLATVEKNHGVASSRLDDILTTHLIGPPLLRSDDFDVFIRDRASRLLDLVEKAIGKAVVGRDAEEVVEAFGGSLASAASSSSTPQDGGG